MKISIVIPTLNRPHSILRLCESVLKNKLLPDEVIIVEQGDVQILKKKLGKYIEILNIKIVYLELKSAAAARHTGSMVAKGDLIFFFDDDIEIGTDYIESAVNFFRNNANALGVTGSYNKEIPSWSLKKIAGLAFGVFSLTQNNTVLPSGCYDYVRGNNLKKIQNVEWLFGCNMIIRRCVFEKYSFNLNFINGSFGEDVMFTYRIYKENPSSLYYLPCLSLVHHEEQLGKVPTPSIIKMKIIYRYIFWKREVYLGSYTRSFLYLWSHLGLLGLDLIQTKRISTLLIYVRTFIFIIQNRKEIDNNTINYNSYIFS